MPTGHTSDGRGPRRALQMPAPAPGTTPPGLQLQNKCQPYLDKDTDWVLEAINQLNTPPSNRRWTQGSTELRRFPPGHLAVE